MHRLTCYDFDTEGIRLLPFANIGFALDEAEAIEAHDKQHRASDGIGWDQAYALKTPPQPLETLAIPAADFRERLAPYAPQYETVTVRGEFGIDFSGDETFSYIGFGPTAEAGIVAECEDGVVKTIWCALPGKPHNENTVLADMPPALDRGHGLVLVGLVDGRGDPPAHPRIRRRLSRSPARQRIRAAGCG